MGENWSVRAEGLSKKFGRSISSSMRYGMRDSLDALFGRRVAGELLREGEFWAVKDVSFELNRGESLGIMGVNGSGKSTLLRLLTGVYRPDTGRIALRGTTGALIAAGAGFAPMLTGRENVYVNGALLGMSRAEIDRRMEEIIAFAELEGFLDMPVKNYSSGMAVRLGFAVAAMSEPDILIVDEVLAVGDVNFQKKCYDYLFRLKQSGSTIILVSHAVGAVWAVCDRAVFMDRGEVRVAGPVEHVIRAYEDENARAAMLSMLKVEAITRQDGPSPGMEEQPRSGPDLGTICRNLSITSLGGDERAELDYGEGFRLSIDVANETDIEDFLLRFVIDAAHYRYVATIDSYENGYVVERLPAGRHRFHVEVRTPTMRPGTYAINVAALSRRFGLHLFLANKIACFVVRSPQDRFFYSDPTAVFQMDATFSRESGAT